MIVQACLNGARDVDFHPALPLTVEAMARDGASCVAAGAAELHLHTRDPDRRESLGAVAMDATVLALRHACPGTLIGVSTGEWIERDELRTLASIEAWNELPDYASVNLGERAAPAVMEKLRQRGIGIEAGLASIADAERLAKLDIGKRVLRILIEISEQDGGEAQTVADGIFAVLDHAEVRRPLLLHGFDDTVWQFVNPRRGSTLVYPSGSRRWLSAAGRNNRLRKRCAGRRRGRLAHRSRSPSSRRG